MAPTHPVPDLASSAPVAPAATRHGSLRRALWLALAVGLVADLVTVVTVDDPAVSSGIGGLVLLCAAALGVLALRHGPRSGGAA